MTGFVLKTAVESMDSSGPENGVALFVLKMRFHGLHNWTFPFSSKSFRLSIRAVAHSAGSGLVSRAVMICSRPGVSPELRQVLWTRRTACQSVSDPCT